MSSMTNDIDHLVIDVGQQIDEAEATYRNLGFHLTPRGRHSVGSVNHLAVFEGPYLELLGFEAAFAPARADILGFPTGLNGLVFQPRDPDRIYDELIQSGVSALPPSDLSRPVATADGVRTASFKVVRLAPGSPGFGRLYFCHHFTPELVWAPDRPPHANGATRIAKVRVIAEDIDAAQGTLAKILPGSSARQEDTATVVYHIGECVIEIMHASQLSDDLRAILPEPSGRSSYMAVLSFVVDELDRTKAVLRANGIAMTHAVDRIFVPAHVACNVGIEFIQDRKYGK